MFPDRNGNALEARRGQFVPPFLNLFLHICLSFLSSFFVSVCGRFVSVRINSRHRTPHRSPACNSVMAIRIVSLMTLFDRRVVSAANHLMIQRPSSGIIFICRGMPGRFPDLSLARVCQVFWVCRRTTKGGGVPDRGF